MPTIDAAALKNAKNDRPLPSGAVVFLSVSTIEELVVRAVGLVVVPKSGGSDLSLLLVGVEALDIAGGHGPA